MRPIILQPCVTCGIFYTTKIDQSITCRGKNCSKRYAKMPYTMQMRRRKIQTMHRDVGNRRVSKSMIPAKLDMDKLPLEQTLDKYI